MVFSKETKFLAHAAEFFRSGVHSKNLTEAVSHAWKVGLCHLGYDSPTTHQHILELVIVTEAGINLLLCLSVYLLLVNSKLPKTSTAFPLLTKFYGSAIIILVLAMCCTCLVYALYFMNSSGLELHHASFFLRLKVRATRKNLFRSLKAQQAVVVTYSSGGVV